MLLVFVVLSAVYFSSKIFAYVSKFFFKIIQGKHMIMKIYTVILNISEANQDGSKNVLYSSTSVVYLCAV